MTYSIVARDPRTGSIGVAVQSRYLAVGAVVPWAEARVGAVATQGLSANVSYGLVGLELMRAGRTAAETVVSLLHNDQHSQKRQIGIVDASGTAFAFTGALCVPACGHSTGEGYSVQGNFLQRESCWAAMAHAFETSLTADLSFSDCLLRALEAAEDEGGDVRGRLSAAIMIVDGTAGQIEGRASVVDLRVDDHPDSVRELRRIVGLHEARELMRPDGDAARAGMTEAERYNRARTLAPGADAVVFQRGVSLALSGDVAAARRELGIAFAANPRWRDALQHLAQAGQLGRDSRLATQLIGIKRIDEGG